MPGGRNEINVGAGEPITAKGRRVRNGIVDAAADLVFERGLAAVTLDDVRSRSGAGRSQLYHYFVDKDDLVRAVIDRQAERVLDFHEAVLGGMGDWDDLERWRDSIIEAQQAGDCRGGCPLGSLANDLAEIDDSARATLAGAFVRWQGLLAAGFARMVEARLLRRDADPDHLAVAVLAALQGGLLLSETTRELAPLEIALGAVLAYVRIFEAG